MEALVSGRRLTLLWGEPEAIAGQAVALDLGQVEMILHSHGYEVRYGTDSFGPGRDDYACALVEPLGKTIAAIGAGSTRMHALGDALEALQDDAVTKALYAAGRPV